MMARVADSSQAHERLLNVTHRRFQDTLVLLFTPHLAVLLSLVVHLAAVRGHVLYATSPRLPFGGFTPSWTAILSEIMFSNAPE